LTPVLSPSILSALETLASLTAGEQGGGRHRVRIRTKERCPKCGRAFQETPLGLLCPKCFTVPRRFFIDLSFKSRRIKIYSTKAGEPLSSWEQAKRLCSIIENEIHQRTFDPSKYVAADIKRFLFEKQWQRWMTLKEKQVEEGTLSPGYLAQIKSYEKKILGFFTSKDVREIRTADVTDFWQKLQSGLSPKTIQNILRLLQGFFNFLLKEEVIERKPSFPEVKIPESSYTWITVEDQNRILKHIQESMPHHYPIFLFLFRQGIRPGEACALKWMDVDLEREVVWIRRTFSARKLKENTKGKRHRLIPLHPEVSAFLRKYAEKVTPFPESFVFLQKNGNPYKDYQLNRIWKNVREALNLPKDLRLYDASRHSVASHLVGSGKPIYLVKEFLGHSDVRVTERYAHLHAENLRQLFSDQSDRPRVIPLEKARKRRQNTAS